MPLSEEELRLLEQMERALSEEDPKFASTLRGTTLRQTARRRAALAGVGFVAGVAGLMTGVITQVWAVGVAGFVVMLLTATLGLNALRGQQVATAAEPRATRGFTVIDGGRRQRPARVRARRQGTFMERLDQRWRRRRDQNGGW